MRRYAFVTACMVSALALTEEGRAIDAWDGDGARLLPALSMPLNPFPATSLCMFLLGDGANVAYHEEEENTETEEEDEEEDL